jgi:large subunit ribosomal protein L4
MAPQAKAKRLPAAKATGSSRGATASGVPAPVLGKTSNADLPGAVFGEEFHESLVHETARADLAARRRGTASALGRGEVSMTTAKAWRQKGTGRARVGALSVPHRRGGGAAFGPTPRAYTMKVNRKARRRALRVALSVHAARGSVAVLEGASFDQPATKQAAQALQKWGAKSPTLLVLDAEEVAALKSFRNIPRVTVTLATAVGVADIIGHASLVISKEALEVLQARASEVERGGRTTGAAEGSSPEESEADGEDSEESDSEE